jgi:hypothetical protein
MIVTPRDDAHVFAVLSRVLGQILDGPFLRLEGVLVDHFAPPRRGVRGVGAPFFAFLIEFLDVRIEADLPPRSVHAGRAGGPLFQGRVHAFVAALLLGIAGLDALDLDAEARPPHGKFGESEEAVATVLTHEQAHGDALPGGVRGGI